MAVEIDEIPSAKSIGWTDALLSRLAANSVGLGGRLSITAPANASALSSTGYSLTGSDATSMIDLAGTWNTSGTPTAFKLNVTDTASNAASLLMDLQTGGTSRFTVVKTGAGFFSTSVSIGNTGFSSVQMDSTGVAIQNARNLKFEGTGAGLISWLNDTILLRDAANTLALRNGTNAQTFNIYNTYTSGSVYERGFMRWASNVLEIGTEHVGATLRPLKISCYNSSASQCAFTNGTSNVGLYFVSNSMMFSDLGSSACGFRGTAVTTRDSGVFCWTNGDAVSTIDTGLKRTIAGVVGITNGSTGGGAIGMQEQTAPAAPAADGVYIYAEDDGAGKTRLMALFASGAAQQIAIEP